MAAIPGSVQVRGRRVGGGIPAGFPALKSREIHMDQVGRTLNLGHGDDGNGNATSVVSMPYDVMDVVNPQSVAGTKTFAASPIVPTPAVGDASTKAATTAFVATAIIAALAGRDGKMSVRAAAVGNVNLASPGANIGGVAMNTGDRFAALNQTTNTEPGIYVWNGATAAATRAADAVQGYVNSGEFFFVDEGAQAGQAYELLTANPITLGTTPLAYEEFDAKGAAQPSGVDGGYA